MAIVKYNNPTVATTPVPQAADFRRAAGGKLEVLAVAGTAGARAAGGKLEVEVAAITKETKPWPWFY